MKKLLAVCLVLFNVMFLETTCFAAGPDDPDFVCEATCLDGVVILSRPSGAISFISDRRLPGVSVCSDTNFGSMEDYWSVSFMLSGAPSPVCASKVFVNIGDGNWHEIEFCSRRNKPWHIIGHFCPNFQYRIDFQCQSGFCGQVKFMGYELLDNINGCLDTQLLRLKDIRWSFSDATCSSDPFIFLM